MAPTMVSEILMLAGILGALLTIIVFLELREAKTKIDDAGSESSIVG